LKRNLGYATVPWKTRSKTQVDRLQSAIAINGKRPLSSRQRLFCLDNSLPNCPLIARIPIPKRRSSRALLETLGSCDVECRFRFQKMTAAAPLSRAIHQHQSELACTSSSPYSLIRASLIREREFVNSIRDIGVGNPLRPNWARAMHVLCGSYPVAPCANSLPRGQVIRISPH
jgi:hypothetical protein